MGKLGLCGVNGKKFPGIRAHMAKAIGGQYKGLDMAMETFPSDAEVDPQAYDKALEHFQPGDAVTIFTPGECLLWGNAFQRARWRLYGIGAQRLVLIALLLLHDLPRRHAL